MDFLIIRRLRRAREQRRIKNLRIIRRELRDTSNPLEEYPEGYFKDVFRLTKEICRTFIHLIYPYMEDRERSTGLTKEQRILCALRFFACGSFQRAIGKEAEISQAQPTVSRCLDEVLEIIDQHIAPQFIKFPTTAIEKNAIKSKFYQKYGIPGIIGLIDCTHVLIKRPPIGVEHVYYSVRKAAHSKNVQIICDSDLKILNVNPKFGGLVNDSFIFNSSSIGQYLRHSYIHGTRDGWLLGDSGYGLLPWLITPVPNPQNISEERFNIAHKICRSTVERCNGVLKSRFRAISRQRILLYDPVKAGKIVNACCTLHNVMILKGYPLPIEEDIAAEIDVNLRADGGLNDDFAELDTATILQNGRRTRNHIIRSNFS